MKILFLGGLFFKEMEEEILKDSKGIVQYAANKLQWNLLDGFIKIKELSIIILSAPFVGAYPREYRKLFIKDFSDIINNSIDFKSVSFCNVWGYRNISRRRSLIKEIQPFLSEVAQDKKIIVYSPHTPFLQAAVYAKKKDPSIHICLIVPDIPQFMNLNEKRTLIYDGLKKIDIEIFNENSKFVDSFVLLTEPMKDILNIGKRPYIVIEGVVNIEEGLKNTINKNNEKIIVYTGTLNKKFGVINLVKAFYELNMQDTSLKICGRGDSEDIIREYVSKDSRIDFLGQLSNDEAVNLQKNATILINPRQNNEAFTKYSFPSKNMEYLLSGNPVIAYKLDGIPKEYDDYFFYVEDDTIKALSNMMERVLTITEEERASFGKRARDFVINEKNNYSASRKIFEMIIENRCD